MQFHGFREEADAIHLRHALVSEKKRDGIVAGFEFAERGDGGAARVCTHDAIAVRIAAAQIALDGAQDLRVVVDREQNWFGHTPQMNGELISLRLCTAETTDRKSVVVGKECRSRWSPYH